MKRGIALWMTFLLGGILPLVAHAEPLSAEPNATRVVVSITVQIHPIITSLAEAETFSSARNRSPLDESCGSAFGTIEASGAESGFRIDGGHHYTCRLSISSDTARTETGDRTLRFIPT